MVRFIWDVEPTINWVITLVFLVLIYALLVFMYVKIVRRTVGYIAMAISGVGLLLSFLFSLTYSFILIAVIMSALVSITFFANLGDLRQFIANPFKISHIKSSKVVVEKIYNREELYNCIEQAVINLSKTRTGAIITFEKNTSLNDVIKNGVGINAPVTSELLTTIFYPGTRLHDGAVVIRENMIIAASVFYTPTTKPFAGKYGSRHRAAIGISEISDAVTVIVSEETGRISFAVNGQLDTVTQETFRRVFENYMDGVSDE